MADSAMKEDVDPDPESQKLVPADDVEEGEETTHSQPQPQSCQPSSSSQSSPSVVEVPSPHAVIRTTAWSKETTSQEPAQDDQDVEGVVVDLEFMKNSVYFLYPDRNQRLSRFWILLLLASVIATSGVVSDSPATVIGAMIIAPLMIPMLGMVLSIVLVDKRNFTFSLLLVVSGVGSCILIGYIFGLCVHEDVISKDSNSQIEGRVSPKLSDLLGAIATGAVGAIALVRKDIAGALPGVAISISLVPPLCVVGLTLSTGDLVDAGGAMLLFVCNFMSIQVMGIIIMYFYKVHQLAGTSRSTKSAFLILLICLGLVAIPLSFTTTRIADERRAEDCIHSYLDTWVEKRQWETKVVVARTEGKKLSASVVVTGDLDRDYPDQYDSLDIGYLEEECQVDFVSISFLPVKEYEV